MLKLTLLSMLQVVFSGAPNPVPNITNKLVPTTCGDMKDRFDSAQCCDSADTKPYVPKLSGSCQSVPVIWDIDWNTTALGTQLKNMFTQEQAALSGITAEQWPHMKEKYFIDFMQYDTSIFTWFNSDNPSKRAGFTMLFDAVKLEFENGDPTGELKKAYTDSWKPENSMTDFLPQGTMPTSKHMDALEVYPSCDMLLFNMNGGAGMTMESYLGFYKLVMLKMHASIFIRSDLSCVTSGKLAALVSEFERIVGDAGSITLKISEDHPTVC